MINNIVLVSGVQQSDSVIHIEVSILFQIPFPFRLLQNTEQSSLCYTVGPCSAYMLSPIFQFIPPPNRSFYILDTSPLSNV